MFGLKARLILSLCIEVPVPSQRSCNCICVLGYPFASFYDFDIWFWNCSDCGVFCLSVYCSRMKIVYRGFSNNIPVRFGSNWHYSFREKYYFCTMANKNMNNLFHYCFFFGFVFLFCSLFFQNEHGIFMQDLQNIIPEKFGSNSPSSFRGEDCKVKSLQTTDIKWWQT